MARAAGTSYPSGYPSRTDGWLGSSRIRPLPTVPASVPTAPQYEPLQFGATRPSYDLAGIAASLGSFWHVPPRIDLNLVVKLRESIPLLSGAILRMKQLVGWPEIEAAPRVKRDIDNFLKMLPNGRSQQGAKPWGQTHLDNCFCFGRAHTEILLTATRSDVHSLVEVDPRTTAFRPLPDGYNLAVAQWQYGGSTPVPLDPALTLTTVNDLRGDDPQGTSMIADIPFVADIYTKMLRAMGSTWDRFGTPTYFVKWNPPKDWNDPAGSQVKTIMAAPQAQMQQWALNKANGKNSDIFLAGDFTIEIMGAQGETLEFSESARTIAEQMCARWGIPPFMFGFSWASTERMSTAQAKAVTEIIDNLRDMFEPSIRQLIELRQAVTGGGSKFELRWPPVSLQDLLDVARADLMEQQAEQLKLENLQSAGRLGIWSMEEIAQQIRPDLEGLSPEEIRERLPDLAAEVPEPVPVQVAGLKQPPADAGNPADESVSRLLAYQGNGNGNEH